MRILRYGFFGEDEAQRLFLHHYLTLLAKTFQTVFESDETFALVGGSKSQVDNRFVEACEIGLIQHRQNCFFIGRGLDDYSPEAFREKVADMQARLRSRDVAAILLIPVQCIEHWLLYLQWRVQNPRLTKNISFETMPRKEAKIKVYGKPKMPLILALPIVEELAASLDIEWLASRSSSFLAFHQQVVGYLATHPATSQ